jgi:hypothetical protein
MNIELRDRSLTTADLVAAAVIPTAPREVVRDLEAPVVATNNSDVKKEGEQLAPLFLPDVATDFRSRWDAVQSSFVDDPRQSVRQGDELVAQVMKSLAETFSSERAKLEGEIDQTDKASTEDLRVALRRYRSFFERLLSL